MEKIIIPIRGMHCKSCELLIEEKIKEVEGVQRVEVSHTSGKAKVWFKEKKPSSNSLNKAIENSGYTAGAEDKKHFISRNSSDYAYLFKAGLILLALYILSRMVGLGSISTSFNQKSIAMAGVIGLVAGVSSCMALVGGLVLATSARYAEKHPESTSLQKFRPHLFFNLGRIIGFAVLGGAIGALGGVLQPSLKAMSVLTIFAGVVMVILGLKLIEIFPILQKVNITLPKAISHLLGFRQQEKEYSHKGAFMAGVFTFFLPCGFTQAMQLFAISTGSFVQGALIMSLFALGTAPGLLGIGGLTSVFKGSKARLLFTTAGLAVIFLGWLNITNASRIVFPKNNSVASSDLPAASSSDQGVQTINTVYKSGSDISPRNFTVKAGQPVEFVVDVKDDGSGCMSTIMIPGLYNKPQYLEQGSKLMMNFTPTKKGTYPITCAMGVKRGVLTVE